MPALVSIDPRSDQERFLTSVMLNLAKKYKVRYTFYAARHELVVTKAEDGSRGMVCACGWRKRFGILAMLTTKSDVITSAIEEHVLSFTDPNHYTYYPQHSEGR